MSLWARFLAHPVEKKTSVLVFLRTVYTVLRVPRVWSWSRCWAVWRGLQYRSRRRRRWQPHECPTTRCSCWSLHRWTTARILHAQCSAHSHHYSPVRAVLKVNSQSNWKGQISTPCSSKTPEQTSMKFNSIYNLPAGRFIHMQMHMAMRKRGWSRRTHRPMFWFLSSLLHSRDRTEPPPVER